MSRESELLALRKEVLVARSSFLRLKAAAEVRSVRASLTFREIGGAMAASSGIRSALFGSLLLVAGSRGLGKLLRMAGAALALVRGATALVGLVGK
ncbi:MAG TPA: hypothetical protein VHQ02_11445 [Usitatibacter sp.]|nr:hypothetical protein [Usitatibacter sp.]